MKADCVIGIHVWKSDSPNPVPRRYVISGGSETVVFSKMIEILRNSIRISSSDNFLIEGRNNLFQKYSGILAP